MIGENDEKKYITIIKISLICFFSVLITLFIAFFIAIDYVDAESISITPSEAYWYNYNNQLTQTTQVSEIIRAGDTFKVWSTSNQNSEAMSTNIYFDENYNDAILSNRYDISFSMLAYGDVTIRLGQYACFYTNTYSVSDFYTGTGQYNNETIVNTHYPKYYDVWCPNVKVNSVPVKFTMFRTFNNGNSSEDRLAISKFWGFSKTNNEFNDTNIINAISGIGSAINNATSQDNSNTQAIINNQNQNNQTIINNQNEIAQEQEEQQRVCNKIKIDKKNIQIDGCALTNTGVNYCYNVQQYGITDFIEVENVTILQNSSSGFVCFYNENKENISCQYATATGNINLPNGTKYMKATINKDTNKPQYEVKTCKNGNQAINDNQQQINDTLNDSSIDDPSSNLSQMESQMPTNSTISDLLTLPVRLFQNVINAIDGNCSPFSLGSLYGTNITLPCINLQNLIGSNLYGVIDVILSGIFVLSIRKKFVDIFENLTSLKNGGNELE